VHVSAIAYLLLDPCHTVLLNFIEFQYVSVWFDILICNETE
jgi:hypothetical protein